MSNIHGPLKHLITNHSELVSKIQSELLEPVNTGIAREISTQTPTRVETTERRHDPDDDPLRVGPPRVAPRQPWYTLPSLFSR